MKSGEEKSFSIRAQELCESRGGRRGLPVPNSPYGLCGRKATLKKKKKKKVRKVVYAQSTCTVIWRRRRRTKTPELRSCVKVEVDVLGSPSPVFLMVSVDVKQH